MELTISFKIYSYFMCMSVYVCVETGVHICAIAYVDMHVPVGAIYSFNSSFFVWHC